MQWVKEVLGKHCTHWFAAPMAPAETPDNMTLSGDAPSTVAKSSRIASTMALPW